MQQLALNKYKLCVLIMSLLTIPSVNSQNLKPVKLSGFTTKQGLSQNNVNAIIYDRNGFLWIGTDDGLNKFDGNSFQIFLPSDNNENGIQYNTVRCIANDPIENSLWIGTNGSLEKMNVKTKEFNRVILQKKQQIEDIRGIVWSNQKEQWVAVNNIGLFYSKGEKYNAIEYPDADINAISAYGDTIFVGGKNGLKLFSSVTHQEIVKHSYSTLSNQDIFSLKIINEFLYVGTSDGKIYVLEHNKKPYLLYSGRNKCKTIEQDKNGNIWVGTEGNGIIMLKKAENFKAYTLLHRKCTNRTINYLYHASNDNIWVGTFGNGIQLYNESDPFFTLSEDKTYGKGLSHNSVTSFEQLDHNNIIIGTDGGGIDRLNLKNGNIENLTKNKYVISLAKSEEKILVGTYQSGLFYLDEKLDLHTYTIYDQYGKDISHDNIWDIEVDFNGNIWLATTNGIVKFNKNTRKGKRYNYDKNDENSLSNDDTRKIYKDIKGDIWIGTFNGLNRYQEKEDNFTQIHFKSHDNKNININNAILSITEDDKLNLWIGTFGNGLWKFNRQSDSFYASVINSKLPNKVIYSIENDTQGILWLSTNQGIISYDPSLQSFRAFNDDDGLQGKQFNVGASLTLDNNYLLFGGTEGLNLFNPKKAMSFLQNAPHIKLNSITIVRNNFNNKVIDTSDLDDITLEPSERNIIFDFIGLEYNYQHNIEYEYRLKNFETKWHTSVSTSSMMYSNFIPGEYVFEIRCRYKNQNWGKTLQFPILLKAFYWETVYFKFLVLLGILILGTTLYILYIRNLKHQKLSLIKLMKERNQELLYREMEIIEVEQQKSQLVQEALEMREKELTTHALRLVHLNSLIDQIDKKLEELQKSPQEITTNKINSIRREIKQAENIEKDWVTLNSLFSEVHHSFIDKLKEKHPSLTEGNLRLCNLIKLNMSSKDIAAIMGISLNSVKVARKRLRKRLDLEIEDSLEDYLNSL